MKRNKNPELDQFLELMFDPGEMVCAAPDRFVIEPKQQSEVTINDAFITINPVRGDRKKDNVTAFRAFLLEIDPVGWVEMSDTERAQSLEEQKQYMAKVPWSACIYSGNKSYHFLVVLDRPLSQEGHAIYADYFRHLLTKIDPGVKNAVTGVRVPGHLREETGLEQELIEIRPRISLSDLFSWFDSFGSGVLAKVEDKIYKPRRYESTGLEAPEGDERGRLNRRTRQFLEEGVPQDSNWHTERNLAALDLMSQNYPIEEAEEMISNVTGYLDDQDLYQIKWCFDNGKAADFRPKKKSASEGGQDE